MKVSLAGISASIVPSMNVLEDAFAITKSESP